MAPTAALRLYGSTASGSRRFDLYTAGSQTAQVVWQTSLKPNVKHTIRIVVTGTHAAASTGTRVDVDAFLTAE